MSSILDLAASLCGGEDEDEGDEIDFCGMPSDQIVEIAVRRDFLLLRLQALVDAQTVEDAEAAISAMSKEAGKDEKLLRFLVRAGTVDIIKGNKLLGSTAAAGSPLLNKLLPYHEQRQLREMERKRRGSWGRLIMTGSG